MLEVISLARAWIAEGKSTSMDAGLLHNLVEANMFDDGQLSDDELLSDTFVRSTLVLCCVYVYNFYKQTYFIAGHGILYT